jgi:hypothetical protein
VDILLCDTTPYQGVLSVSEAGELLSMLAVHAPVRAAECVRALTQIGAVDALVELAIPRHCVATCAWAAWMEAARELPQLASHLLLALESVLAVDGTPIAESKMGKYHYLNFQFPVRMYGMSLWNIQEKHASALRTHIADQKMEMRGVGGWTPEVFPYKKVVAFMLDPIARVCEFTDARGNAEKYLKAINAHLVSGDSSPSAVSSSLRLGFRRHSRDGVWSVEIWKTRGTEGHYAGVGSYQTMKTKFEKPTHALLLESGYELLCAAVRGGSSQTFAPSASEARAVQSVARRLLVADSVVVTAQHLRQLQEAMDECGGAGHWLNATKKPLQLTAALQDLRQKPSLTALARVQKMLCSILSFTKANAEHRLTREMNTPSMFVFKGKLGLAQAPDYWECVGFLRCVSVRVCDLYIFDCVCV